MVDMDEDAAIIESILREEAKLNGEHIDDDDHGGWKTVSYPRRQRKQHPPLHTVVGAEENGVADVFRQLDHQAEQRRRRIVEAQRAALEEASGVGGGGSKEFSGEDSDGDDSDAGGVENGNVEVPVKKPKAKKVKKPKVSVAEAAAKLDADDLAAFLVDISGSYESQEDIQLMRFADYFGRAFASVGSAQFPWMKMLKESTVAKMVDIPLFNMPEAVYKTSMDWLNRRSLDALGSLVLSLWDGILADLASHQGPVKGSKKVAQQPSSKSQVALFIVLGMILRRKPDVLICLLPILKESQKYVGQDRLPVAVWVIAQASQGDLVVGLYVWVQVFLPMVNGKSVNPQSRDLILQLVERILSMPKARQILLNGAVRKGERLVTPAALDILMRLTFTSSSSRIKATERFEAVYPTLKEVALAGASGSKAMKQVAQQILGVAFQAAGEGVPELSNEASDVFIWCLTESSECFKQWDILYLNNIVASAIILRKLAEEKKLPATPSTLGTVKATLKSFRQKNEKALDSEESADRQSHLKEADKYCKSLLSQSQRHGCLKGFLVISAVLAVSFAVLSANMQPDDLKQLLAKFDLETLKTYIS